MILVFFFYFNYFLFFLSNIVILFFKWVFWLLGFFWCFNLRLHSLPSQDALSCNFGLDSRSSQGCLSGHSLSLQLSCDSWPSQGILLGHRLSGKFSLNSWSHQGVLSRNFSFNSLSSQCIFGSYLSFDSWPSESGLSCNSGGSEFNLQFFSILHLFLWYLNQIIWQ